MQSIAERSEIHRRGIVTHIIFTVSVIVQKDILILQYCYMII
jgi:hypothetical protein